MANDGTLRLRPSAWRHVMLLLLSAAFTAMGVFLVREGAWIGWLCVAFFGIGVVVAILALVPGSSYLELRRDGFELSALYRRWFVRWVDVESFFPARVGPQAMVCWNYAPGYTGQATGRTLSIGLAGVEAGLPDTYGLSPQALSELMNDWRVRHAGPG